MHETFVFDKDVCEKCEYRSTSKIHEMYKNTGFYCWIINDVITWEGKALSINTRTDLTLKDINENYDPRVEKCPFKLEHIIRADAKRIT